MKRFCLVLALAAGMFSALGQSADEFYVRVYDLIQEADTLSSNMQYGPALQKYRDAQTALQTIQKGNPDWQASIIKFRLTYVADRIAELAQKVPDATPPQKQDASGKSADPVREAASTALEGQVRVLRQQVRTMQAERDKLEAKLREALAVQPAAADPRELAKAEQRIVGLQKEVELLKVNLSQAQAKAQQPPPAAEPDPKLTAQIRELERERESLVKQLESAEKEIAAARKSAKGRGQDLEKQVASLQAKLDALQAAAVPYTAEELALFNAPAPVLAAKPAAEPAGEKAPPKNPEAIAALAKEAQRHFAAGRLEQARERFLEVLKLDKTDVVTLGNLAVVELELNQLEAAGKHIGQALALAPEDAFSLGVLGRLRFQQKRLDEAIEMLSRAAKIDPNNAEIQNHLGLVLSEKGMRAPAESALRKAVQLRPAYGSAHQNLAVVYVNQNPPMVELARFHYQKALSAGAAPNQQLENLIESKRKMR